MKRLLILLILVGAGYQGWKQWQSQSVEPLYGEPYLVVYGRDSCGVTQQTLAQLKSAGVKFHYQSVDDRAVADLLHARMQSKGIDTRHYLLPVVDLNNTISIRPDGEGLVSEAKKLAL